MEEVKLYSTTEAAKILGISRQLLNYRVKKKKILPVAFIKSKYLFFSELEIEKALLWHPKGKDKNVSTKSAAINNNSTAAGSNGAS